MQKKLAVAAIVVFALVGLIIGVGIVRRRSHAAELERYKASLRERGEKLTFAELAIPPSIDATDVTSRTAFANNQFRDVDATPLLMHFMAAGKARAAWKGDLLLPGTNDDDPSELLHGDWNAFRQQNLVIIDALKPFTDAISHPPPDDGGVYQDTYSNALSQSPRPYHALSMIRQGLVNETLLNLYDTNLAPAVQNIHALAGLAGIYRNNLEFLVVVVRARFTSDGLAATWEALQQTGWNDTELADLQRCWMSVDLLEGLERSLVAERIFNILLMDSLRRMGTAEFVRAVRVPPAVGSRTPEVLGDSMNDARSAIYKVGGFDGDELMQLQYWTEVVDAVREIRSGKPVSTTLSPVEVLQAQDLDRVMKMSNPRRWIDGMALPDLSHSIKRILQIETQRRMTIVAIGIKRYELQHGAAPSSLAALAPDFLDAVPMDLMSGKPLCYRLKPDGTFLLYSTGEDGKDDGGDPIPKDGGTDYGLWEGRDAVWPAAATPEEEAAWENSMAKTNSPNPGTH